MTISLSEKIGQLLIIGFRGSKINECQDLVQHINNKRIGGIILFDLDYKELQKYSLISKKSIMTVRNNDVYDEKGNLRFKRNIESPTQLRKLTKELQEIAYKSQNTPLLISLDHEGGLVTRLSSHYGFCESIAAKDFAELSINKKQEMGAQYANTMCDSGINYVFGPVVDLELNPNNPVLSPMRRCFGDNSAKVIENAEILVKAYANQSIACSIKHFPGHGSSMSDSHEGFTDVSKLWQETELDPYKFFITKDYPNVTIMTAHIVNDELDNTKLPATLSYNILTNLLRKQLQYDGVVISDDLQMGAITDNFSFEDTVKYALQAGVDILLFGNQFEYDINIPDRVISIVKELISKGEVAEQRINESYNRVMELKKYRDNG